MGQQLGYGGGSPILFQHLFWFFGHPEVYIVALPAFGIVSDLISTHARKNIFGYRMMVWAIVAIGALSFVVWAHHMYVSGMDPYFGFFFATTTLIIAVPTAIKVYNWVLTLWRGDIHLTVPMLFALGFIVTFVNGGLTGLFLGNVVVDVPLSDTMFVVAHFHMVMGVAPIMVIFGAIYHWYPKVTGRMLDETLGQFHFWVTFLGAYAIFFPMHYLGLIGVPRRYHELGRDRLHPGLGHTLNAFISVVALIVGAAQLVFLFNLFWSLRHGQKAGGNPWRATTLEWQTPETPPAHGNWGRELPVVYRWAYDYSVPGAAEDFIPQNQPPAAGAAWQHPRDPGLFAGLWRVAARWLSHQGLATKPWLEAGHRRAVARPPAGRRRRSALAYSSRSPACCWPPPQRLLMRMDMADWRPLPAAGLLWVNTACWCSSGPALGQGAAAAASVDGVRRAARRRRSPALSWPDRSWPGDSSPPPATGRESRGGLLLPAHRVHGLHLLGGLVALGRTGGQALAGPTRRAAPGVELCATYWHFLLLAWFALRPACLRAGRSR